MCLYYNHGVLNEMTEWRKKFVFFIFEPKVYQQENGKNDGSRMALNKKTETSAPTLVYLSVETIIIIERPMFG